MERINELVYPMRHAMPMADQHQKDSDTLHDVKSLVSVIHLQQIVLQMRHLFSPMVITSFYA